ncbi:hypothetical protein, partial [Alistipes putredinis]|uniref:hypothetical protein n=1 Tax=Alistipes putredinis TaxID=28117 RepID=UPI003AB3D4E8
MKSLAFFAGRQSGRAAERQNGRTAGRQAGWLGAGWLEQRAERQERQERQAERQERLAGWLERQ